LQGILLRGGVKVANLNIELRGLRGLSSLDNLLNEAPTKDQLENIQQLSIDSLMPSKYQPRKIWDEQALSELAESICSQGIIQPLIVRSKDDNKFEIIAGERRWRAAKLAGLTSIPAVIRDVEDNVALAFALIENIQREDLNPLEEAYAFCRFKDDFSMTHSDIAKMVGRSRTSITNTIRLLSLDDSVKKLLEENHLDMGHARALLTLDTTEQVDLAQKIADQKLSVRQAEELAYTRKIQKSRAPSERVNKYTSKQEFWASELSKKLSTKVTVKLNNSGEGKVIIHIEDPSEIDWLLNNISIS